MLKKYRDPTRQKELQRIRSHNWYLKNKEKIYKCNKSWSSKNKKLVLGLKREQRVIWRLSGRPDGYTKLPPKEEREKIALFQLSKRVLEGKMPRELMENKIKLIQEGEFYEAYI